MRLDPDNPVKITYREARRQFRPGDVMLYRSKRMIGFSGLIRRATGGAVHSHAEMICPEGGDWYTCGMVEWSGFSKEPLEGYAREWSGKVDLFHVARELTINGRRFIYNGETAAQYMLGLRDWKYGWRGIARLAIRKMPGLWFFVKPDISDDLKDERFAFCSDAVARAMQVGGMDPLVNCPPYLVTPHGLFCSPLIGHGYYGTLVDPEKT